MRQVEHSTETSLDRACNVVSFFMDESKMSHVHPDMRSVVLIKMIQKEIDAAVLAATEQNG